MCPRPPQAPPSPTSSGFLGLLPLLLVGLLLLLLLGLLLTFTMFFCLCAEQNRARFPGLAKDGCRLQPGCSHSLWMTSTMPSTECVLQH